MCTNWTFMSNSIYFSKKEKRKKKVQLYMMIVVPCRVEPQQKIICLVRGQTIYLVWLEWCLSWFEVYWYNGPQTPDSADFSASVQTFNLQFIWFGWSCNVPLMIWGLFEVYWGSGPQTQILLIFQHLSDSAIYLDSKIFFLGRFLRIIINYII